MNREVLKQKIRKSLKWIYENDATQGDRLLMYATDNSIAYEPFFINRHSANLDEFINSATDYLFRIDKDNSVLIRVAEFPLNVSGFQTFPSDYAQIINANVSGRSAKKGSGGGSSGGGSGIINIGSLEGLGSLIFTPKETLTTTTTTTTPSKEVVKQSGTNTIVIVIVAVLLIALLIFFLTKK